MSTVNPPASRNAPCPCGSGRRYKHCHGTRQADTSEASDGSGASAVSTLLQQGRLSEAIEACKAQLRDVPNHIPTLRALGEALARRDATDDASDVWKQIVKLKPGDAEALFWLGSLSRLRGDYQQAIHELREAHRQAPLHVGILTNLGLSLGDSGQLAEAETSLRAACDLAPDAFETLANLAQNLYRQRRFDEALRVFNALVHQHDVRQAAIWANRGVCAIHAGDLDTAQASLAAATSRGEPSPELCSDLGFLNLQLKRYAEAASAFEAGLALRPNHLLTESALLFSRQNLADWNDFDALRDRLVRAAASSELDAASISPFAFQTICDDPALQRRVAEAWWRGKEKVVVERPGVTSHQGPVRIGFVSSDLFEHPVGRLLVELIERLDHRTHVTMYAVGPDRQDAVRSRLQAAADVFRCVPPGNQERLANVVHADAIDVLFDLNGLTGESHSELFAKRVAPMQINFLGYTGTLGSSAYDYILSDHYCIPESDRAWYTERPLRVDPCYLPSDCARNAGSELARRSDYDLPEAAVVLCAFASTCKILPGVFDVWIALLARYPCAVLWLRDAGDDVNARLRDRAMAGGVDANRVLFAPAEPVDRYLSRFRLADLFVDTVPFGSHTTVNDALHAGLPVLTVRGSSFAGRASASQVRASGLERLIAGDLIDYRSIAHQLLAEPRRLQAMSLELAANAKASPLFDMEAYARRFTVAILSVWRELIGAA